MYAALKENAAFAMAAQNGSLIFPGSINNQGFPPAMPGGGYAQYGVAVGSGVLLPLNPSATIILPQIQIAKRAEGMAAKQHAKFFEYLKANKSEKTAQGYFYDVRNVLTVISKNSFENKPLDKLNLALITADQVKQAERNLIKSSDFQPSTLERMKQGWNQFCLFLGMAGWKFEVKINAAETYRDDAISTEDVKKMLKYCQEQRATAKSDAEIIRWYRKEIAIRLGFEMGFRSCEYSNVTFNAVERGKRIFIKHSKADGSRKVPLTKEIKAVVAAFKAFLEERNMLPKNGGVFEKTDGKHYSTSSFRRWLKQTAEACGIPTELAQTHGLRHRYAKNFYSHSKNLLMLARFMGHKSTKTTKQYAEPTFEDAQEAMQAAVDNAYGSVQQSA
jgi:site-specific recombinase XerD